jgi:hypothetical protein
VAKKKAAKKIEGVKELGREISQTNCFFIQLKAYGSCNENGKTAMAVEFSTKKIIAKPDRPLLLMQHMLCEMMRGMRYSNEESANADVASFKEWASGLEVN